MKKILIGIGIVTLLVGIVWADRALNTLQVNAKTSKFNEDVDTLFIALQKYKEQVGSYPAGSNLEISRALQGKNSNHVIVVMGNKASVNEKGEFIDPWGTPLRIYFSSDSGILVRSAGPNRHFDDSTVIGADDFYRSN